MQTGRQTLTRRTGPGDRRSERGSALIIATLVSVIMSLLGISYMMMAQTENIIAENERNAAMALYAAEAGTRLAINWLNDPSSTGYLVPTTGQVDRTQRVFDHDNNAGTARVLASSGNAGQPIYKDSSFTTSTILDRPYRAALSDTFLGVETGTDGGFPTAGPDLVVAASHLATINDALFPNFPTPHLRARVVRIEFYAPPIVGGQRMGVATVKVIGGVFIHPGTANERQIATRVVKAVVNEIPVPGPVGPLQSCASLGYTGDFRIHWGAGSSQAGADIPTTATLDTKVNTGLPYSLNDPFTYYNDGTNTLATWAAHAEINGRAIDDPWLKFIAGGPITFQGAAAGTSAPQVFPFTWPPVGNPNPSATSDHSNLFQNTIINCPTFDYALWKSIAQSGGKNHYYYKYAGNGTNYLLDGTGSAVSFITATSGKTGVFFFDTYDSLPPRNDWNDTMGSGVSETNLTPIIDVASGGGWNGVQGFVFLNTQQFSTSGSGSNGSTRLLIPPGEPGDGSGFVNLQYPTTGGVGYTVRNGTVTTQYLDDPATGIRYCTDSQSCVYGGAAPLSTFAPVQDGTGIPVSMTNVVLDGVMYISGTYSAKGNAKYFGSLVAQQGVIDGGGTPDFYFDESLIEGNWPRKGMNLPRVVVTAWETEL